MAAANRNKILLLIAVDQPFDAEGPTGPFREGVRRVLYKHCLGRKPILTELHHHLQQLLVAGKARQKSGWFTRSRRSVQQRSAV